jgi:hypothetical protein
MAVKIFKIKVLFELFITSDCLEAKEKIWDAAPKEGTRSLRVHSRVHTRTGSIFNESSRGNAPSSQLKAAPPQVETQEFTTQNYKYERQLYYFISK